MPNSSTVGVFPSPFNLASLDGNTGVKIYGAQAGLGLGSVLIPALNFNGDAFLEYGICVSQISTCYLFWGKQGGLTSSFNMSSINSNNNGITFIGASRSDLTGISADSLGDIAGRGFDALAIGAVLANSQTGCVYIVYGSNTGFPSQINLVTSSNVIICGNTPGDYIGLVKGVSDVNGDNLPDFIVGSSFTGKFYLLFGNSNGLPSQINLNNINGLGVALLGINSNGLGWLSSVPDINGDGLNEFTISDNNVGKVYLIYGKRSFPSPINLLNYLNGTTGTIFVGSAALFTGFSLLGTKNIYGDGKSSLLIGEPGLNTATYTGKLYLIDAKNGGYPATVNLASPGGTKVTTFTGANSGDQTGYSLAALDLNWDNCTDIVSCSISMNGQTGGCVVVFGNVNGYLASVGFATLTGSNGIVINGINSGDYTGVAAVAIDGNGDGIPDLFIGASAVDSNTGAAYTVYGRSVSFPSPSSTPTPSQTVTPTITPTSTVTPTVTPTRTVTPTGTSTPSETHSSTDTPSVTQTSSFTPSSTITSSGTPSFTPSSTITSSGTPSVTPSTTPTQFVTPSGTPSMLPTPSGTSSMSSTPSGTSSMSSTPSKAALGAAPVPATDSGGGLGIQAIFSIVGTSIGIAGVLGGFVFRYYWNKHSAAKKAAANELAQKEIVEGTGAAAATAAATAVNAAVSAALAAALRGGGTGGTVELAKSPTATVLDQSTAAASKVLSSAIYPEGDRYAFSSFNPLRAGALTATVFVAGVNPGNGEEISSELKCKSNNPDDEFANYAETLACFANRSAAEDVVATPSLAEELVKSANDLLSFLLSLSGSVMNAFSSAPNPDQDDAELSGMCPLNETEV